jgi:hypothetical protein
LKIKKGAKKKKSRPLLANSGNDPSISRLSLYRDRNIIDDRTETNKIVLSKELSLLLVNRYMPDEELLDILHLPIWLATFKNLGIGRR